MESNQIVGLVMQPTLSYAPQRFTTYPLATWVRVHRDRWVLACLFAPVSRSHSPGENLVDFDVGVSDLHKEHRSRTYHPPRNQQAQESHEEVVLVLRDCVVDLHDEFLDWCVELGHQSHKFQVKRRTDEVTPLH